jgi:hypothetical protein
MTYIEEGETTMTARRIFPLKLSDEEKGMLAEQASAQSMDMSGYLRWLIRQVDRGQITSKMVRRPGRPALQKGDRK